MVLESFPDELSYAMEWVHGTPLEDWVGQSDGYDEDKCSLGRALNAGEDLIEGLAALHGVGQVHGALDMRRLIREPDGRLRILGVGRKHDRADPHFMAPEQAGVGDVGPATDRWQAAAVIFRLVAGRDLYVGDWAEIFRQAIQCNVEESLISLRESQPDLADCLAPALRADGFDIYEDDSSFLIALQKVRMQLSPTENLLQIELPPSLIEATENSEEPRSVEEAWSEFESEDEIAEALELELPEPELEAREEETSLEGEVEKEPDSPEDILEDEPINDQDTAAELVEPEPELERALDKGLRPTDLLPLGVGLTDWEMREQAVRVGGEERRSWWVNQPDIIDNSDPEESVDIAVEQESVVSDLELGVEEEVLTASEPEAVPEPEPEPAPEPEPEAVPEPEPEPEPEAAPIESQKVPDDGLIPTGLLGAIDAPEPIEQAELVESAESLEASTFLDIQDPIEVPELLGALGPIETSDESIRPEAESEEAPMPPDFADLAQFVNFIDSVSPSANLDEFSEDILDSVQPERFSTEVEQFEAPLDLTDPPAMRFVRMFDEGSLEDPNFFLEDEGQSQAVVDTETKVAIEPISTPLEPSVEEPTVQDAEVKAEEPSDDDGDLLKSLLYGEDVVDDFFFVEVSPKDDSLVSEPLADESLLGDDPIIAAPAIVDLDEIVGPIDANEVVDPVESITEPSVLDVKSDSFVDDPLPSFDPVSSLQPVNHLDLSDLSDLPDLEDSEYADFDEPIDLNDPIVDEFIELTENIDSDLTREPVNLGAPVIPPVLDTKRPPVQEVKPQEEMEHNSDSTEPPKPDRTKPAPKPLKKTEAQTTNSVAKEPVISSEPKSNTVRYGDDIAWEQAWVARPASDGLVRNGLIFVVGAVAAWLVFS